MKVNGVANDKKIRFGPLVLKRGEGKYWTFWAQPVWSLDEFRALCPEPVCQSYLFNKDGKQLDYQAPAYLQDVANYHRRRWGYVLLKSLEPSRIEWDKVSLADPKTWDQVEQELRGELSVYEFAKLAQLVDEANALDEDKLRENAKDFFRLSASVDGDAQNLTG